MDKFNQNNILISTSGKSVKFTNLKENKNVFSIEGHSGRITAIKKINKHKIATASKDKDIKIWDLTLKQCIINLSVFDAIEQIGVFDEHTIITRSINDHWNIWDLKKERSISEFKLSIEEFEDFKIINRNQLLINLSNDIAIYKISNGELQKFNTKLFDKMNMPANVIKCIAIQNEQMSITGGEDKIILLWNNNSKLCTGELFGHEKSVGKIVVMLNNNFIVSGSSDNTLRFWDTINLRCLKQVRTVGLGFGDLISVDGVIVICSFINHYNIWNTATDNIYNYGTKERIEKISAVNIHTMISIETINRNSFSNRIVFWEVSTMKEKKEMSILSHPTDINSLIIFGNKLITSCSNTINVWDLTTFVLIDTLKELNKKENESDDDDDSKFIIKVFVIKEGILGIIYKNGNISSINLNTKKENSVIKDYNFIPKCAYFVSEDTMIVGYVNNLIEIWDLKNQENKGSLKGHKDDINCLEFLKIKRINIENNDEITGRDRGRGSIFSNVNTEGFFKREKAFSVNDYLEDEEKEDMICISGSFDNTIRLWDIKKFFCIGVFEGHTGGINCVKVVNNSLIASGSFDCSLKVWDINLKMCIMTIINRQSPIYSLMVLDDKTVICGYSDGSVISSKLK